MLGKAGAGCGWIATPIRRVRLLIGKASRTEEVGTLFAIAATMFFILVVLVPLQVAVRVIRGTCWRVA